MLYHVEFSLANSGERLSVRNVETSNRYSAAMEARRQAEEFGYDMGLYVTWSVRAQNGKEPS